MKRTEADYVADARAIAKTCTSDQQAIADGMMFGGRVAREVIAWEAENGHPHGDHRLKLERALTNARDIALDTRDRKFLNAALPVMKVELRAR